MELWPIITDRWPNRVLAIRRRCAVDPEFRAVVSDYCETRSALERWRSVDPPGSHRITDYEALLVEIEDEIEAGTSND